MSHSISPVDKSPSGECVAVAKEETVDPEIHPMSQEEEDAQVHGEQAEQAAQAVAAEATIQVVLKTMQHITVVVAEVAGITATLEPEQDIKE